MDTAEAIIRETIARLRAEHGSYLKVAQELGIGMSTVQRLEKGSGLTPVARALIPYVCRYCAENHKAA